MGATACPAGKGGCSGVAGAQWALRVSARAESRVQERPQILHRLKHALAAHGGGGGEAGAPGAVSFADFHRVITMHVLPFTPSGLARHVLGEAFLAAHAIPANGWSGRGYLDLIANPGAREWWAQCIGACRPLRTVADRSTPPARQPVCLQVVAR
eukprot:COSAG01_NODE_16521_length_1229_cov_32.663717_1_plen_155_part_00